MLIVCLIWLYVLAVSYVTGYLAIAAVKKICGESKREVKQGLVSYIMAGLIFLTVYAQTFSIFYKVGLAANILLLIICGAGLFWLRKDLLQPMMDGIKRTSKKQMAVFFFLFLLFAYGTSRGILHYDTGLYHAQSIRWIEEYGVVNGLGNLHNRLAYNSASFSLSALFSFSFLGGQSYHTMAGFFALLVAVICCDLKEIFRIKKIRISDFARMTAIYYLLIIFDEMVSPASDYFTVLTIFYIIIRWLTLLEQGESSWYPYALLSLAGVYTISLKLSAALILLLVLKPAYQMLKERRTRAIFSFLFIGLLILAPFLVRNVLLSGWLVYPFTSLDFFRVEFKIPEHKAVYDAKEIQVWGRGLYDVGQYGKPIWEWFGGWYRQQGFMDRIAVAADLAVIPGLLAVSLVCLIKRKKTYYGWLLVSAVLLLSFLFWLCSAPLMRYGCGYVWLTAAVFYGGALQPLMQKKMAARAILLVAASAAVYKAAAFGGELVTSFEQDYFFSQKDYEKFDTDTYEMNGILFYYPKEGDRVGYEAFPSSPVRAEAVLRGQNLKDGFIAN